MVQGNNHTIFTSKMDDHLSLLLFMTLGRILKVKHIFRKMYGIDILSNGNVMLILLGKLVKVDADILNCR